MDHTQRYHEVWVTDNEIVSPGPWALRYYDEAHSANDRTAATSMSIPTVIPEAGSGTWFSKSNRRWSREAFDSGGDENPCFQHLCDCGAGSPRVQPGGY